MAGKRWFYELMGEQHGPVHALELMALAERSVLSRGDLVRREDLTDWVPVEFVNGLNVASQKVRPNADAGEVVKRATRQTTNIRTDTTNDNGYKYASAIPVPALSGELIEMREIAWTLQQTLEALNTCTNAVRDAEDSFRVGISFQETQLRYLRSINFKMATIIFMAIVVPGLMTLLFGSSR